MRPQRRLYPVAVPEFEPPPKAVRDHIVDWYERHSQLYARVWERLDDLRRLWNFLSFEEQVAYLKASSVFAIFTIQTNTPLAEGGFNALMQGTPLHDSLAEPLPEFGEPVGLADQKTDWIYTSLTAHTLWDQAVSLLNQGHVDTAHKLLIDETKGLGAVKAGFTLAQLGFVQKMCIDGNLANLFGGEGSPETVDVAKYEGLCTDIKNAVPQLSEKLEPYQLQWLLFDWQRTFRSGRGKVQKTDNPAGNVATHDEWFSYALGNPDHIRRRMLTLTVEGARMGYGTMPPGLDVDESPPGFEDIDDAIEDAI